MRGGCGCYGSGSPLLTKRTQPGLDGVLERRVRAVGKVEEDLVFEEVVWVVEAAGLVAGGFGGEAGGVVEPAVLAAERGLVVVVAVAGVVLGVEAEEGVVGRAAHAATCRRRGPVRLRGSPAVSRRCSTAEVVMPSASPTSAQDRPDR